MTNRLLCLALLGLCSAAASAQDKTLTFDNASPTKTIHLLNGTSVSISTSGNLTAKCTLSGSNCADIGTGTGSNPPTVSIAASGFSQAADGSNNYPTGTTFTLTPSVTNGDVCVRSIGQGTPSDSGWTGTQTSPFSGTSLTVSTPSSTYTFLLTCYNSGGSATSTGVTVGTQSGAPPVDANCENVTPPSGFTRDTSITTWQQQFGAAFPNSNPAAAQVPKNTQNGTVYLGATGQTFRSIEFTTPTTVPWTNVDGFATSQFNWTEPQIGASAPPAALPSGVYITLSRCAGDFRYNISPLVDQTDAPACKSVRNGSASLALNYNQTGVSSLGECGLEGGKKYYLNYINANPADGGGITPTEHTCSTANCGVAIKHQ